MTAADRPHEPHYDRRHHPYFLRLMERFDVSYRLDDGTHSLIAPLVPTGRPQLPWDTRTPLPPDTRRVALIWRLSTAVTGLMSALTVRLSYARTGLHWRDGVFLKHPNRSHASQALIEVHDRTHLVVEVRAASPDYFFHVIRDSVDYLMQRWPALRYEQLVPCPGRCSGRFKLDKLIDCRERDVPTVQCPECLDTVEVAELLTGFSAPPGINGRRPGRVIPAPAAHETRHPTGHGPSW
jgi:internalin A